MLVRVMRVLSIVKVVNSLTLLARLLIVIVSVVGVAVVLVGLNGLALLLAAAVVIVVDEAHARRLGAEAEDSEVLGGEDRVGVLLGGELVVELTDGGAAVVREGVLRGVEAEVVLPLAVGHEVVVGTVPLAAVLVIVRLVKLTLVARLDDGGLLDDLLAELRGFLAAAVERRLELRGGFGVELAAPSSGAPASAAGRGLHCAHELHLLLVGRGLGALSEEDDGSDGNRVCEHL